MKENDLNQTEINLHTIPIDSINFNTTSNDGLILKKKEKQLNISTFISIDNFKKKFWSLFVDDESENKEKNNYDKLFNRNEIKTEDIDFEREYRKLAEKSISQIYPTIGYMGMNPF
jgi:hypothetical protein